MKMNAQCENEVGGPTHLVGSHYCQELLGDLPELFLFRNRRDAYSLTPFSLCENIIKKLEAKGKFVN